MARIATIAALTVGFITLFCYIATPLMLFPMFFTFCVILSACLALLIGAYELRRVETQPPVPKPRIERVLSRLKTYSPPVMTPTLLSSNVDNHVSRVLNFILNCNVLPAYQMIATDHQPFFNSVVPEIWHVLGLVLGRVSKLNTVKIISQDLVLILRKHFEHFRGIQFQEPVFCSTTFPDLNQFPYLQDTDEEVKFLRQAVDVLLCVCFPADLKQCNSLRLLVREYMLDSLLQPVIEHVCDPDYINQKLLAYLVKKEEEIKSSTHHASYEDFMKEIKKCEDVIELERQRQFIITDLMHAKAVLRMKQVSSKGLRVANFPVSIPADKAKALMERRDLALYITQLTTAKNTCERCIRKFGGDGSIDQQHSVPLEKTVPSLPRAIPFKTIMLNETALMYFLQYLEELGYDHLLSFWTEVEMLQSLTGLELQKQMEMIYKTYLAYDAKRQIYADDSLVGKVEAYLNMHTESTLDALHQVQTAVHNELYSQFYESFICSDCFRTFMDNEVQDDAALFQYPDGGSSVTSHTFEEHTFQKKLKVLRKKLSDKNVALAEFPSISASSSSSNSLEIHRKRLEKDRCEIQEEIKQLEYYIEHTDEWFETVGQWTVEVFNVDLGEDECNEKDPLFILVVHRPDPRLRESATSSLLGSESGSSSLNDTHADDGVISLPSDSDDEVVPSSAGFVVGRHLSEFEALHATVHEVLPNLAFPPLPKKSLLFSRKETKSRYWTKYKEAVEKYIKKLLSDPKLQESEIVFNFLSRASADLHHMSLSKEESNSRRGLLTLHENKTEDSILDHVSFLISEVFELHDRSSVLRRQLYELFQLTFSGSIEKVLQDFVTWVLSEPMLAFYLENMQESFWPSGHSASLPLVRSDEQKEETKEEAKVKLLRSAPKTLETVLGTRNCQIGYLKIFRAFQDRNANKQLLYSIIELLLCLLASDLEEYW